MDKDRNVRRKRICVKSYKLRDLAKIYDVSLYIMRRLITRVQFTIGKREGHYYSAEQVEQIFKLIKLPSNIEIVQVVFIGTQFLTN